MRIGIASPFKPIVISDLLYPGQSIPDIHRSTTSLSEMIRLLILTGHEVTVFTYTRDKIEDVCLEGEGVKVYITSSYRPIKGAIIFSRYYMIKGLRKLIAKEIDQLDVLHAHWTYDYAAAAASFTQRLPVFCTVRDWCPRIIQLQKNIPEFLYWVVNWFVYKKVMSNKSIHFIANSDYIGKMINNAYPRIPVDVIYNLIDDKIIKDTHVSRSDKIVFISISQSAGYKLKNIHRLLLAYKIYHQRNKKSELRLVGAGFQKDGPEVQKWTKEGLMEGVELCGYVNHEKLMEYLDSSTCLVHPSLEESFGNTLLEGMARHIPVIGGQDSGAVPYVLGHGQYGIICNVKNVDSIVEAMSKIEDGTFVEKITNSASEYLKSNFTSKQIVDRHVNLYKQILCR